MTKIYVPTQLLYYYIMYVLHHASTGFKKKSYKMFITYPSPNKSSK